MQLRCKEGDLALIVHDEPSCESNIGRIVQVRGPVMHNHRLQLTCWLIKPVERQPWRVERCGAISSEIVYWKSLVEHPDSWMVPLRPPEDEEQCGNQQHEPDQTPKKISTTPPLTVFAGEEQGVIEHYQPGLSRGETETTSSFSPTCRDAKQGS